MKTFKSTKSIIFVLFILFLISSSCNSGSSETTEIQGISEIEVKTFKKKEVELACKLHYLNVDKKSLKFTYADLDVLVNGKDVGTFISNDTKNIGPNALFELPISISFLPEDAFLDLDYGAIKNKIRCGGKCSI
ncbi:MAG: hypothetical protein LRY27_01625 [Chitinophagales bacterium]|nr:hypothetical protein [Chitinophagales bacterium]